MGRTVALIDMDCFYVQVEQRLNPSLKGKPCAVVQYNEWQGGGIIAVSYEARARGVTRFLRGDSAKKVCPEIELVRVPEVRGKADLTKYRAAGAEVIAVLCQFAKCVERASVDEAYLDLTEEVAQWRLSGKRPNVDDLPNTYVAGYEEERKDHEREDIKMSSAGDDGDGSSSSSNSRETAAPEASDSNSSRARGLDGWLHRTTAPTRRTSEDMAAPVKGAATASSNTAALPDSAPGRIAAAERQVVRHDDWISAADSAGRDKRVADVRGLDDELGDIAADEGCLADVDDENDRGADAEGDDDDEAEEDLAIGAMLVEQMRAAVFSQTGFRCSAGIARNKALAKLACGLHKPNKQTILPPSAVASVYAGLPVNKIRNLGGKLGKKLQKELGISTMAQLAATPRQHLEQAFGEKTGSWLHELSRGIDHEPVSVRHLPKSVGCSKNFRGKNCLDSSEKATHWLQQLAIEIEERLAKDLVENKRRARLLSVHVAYADGRTLSRACPMPPDYAVPLIRANAMAAIIKTYEGKKLWCPPIVTLGLSAGKFAAVDESGGGDLTRLFAAAAADRKAREAPSYVRDCCAKGYDDDSDDSSTSFSLLTDHDDSEQRGDRETAAGRTPLPSADGTDGGSRIRPQPDSPAYAAALSDPPPADVADVGASRLRARQHVVRASPVQPPLPPQRLLPSAATGLSECGNTESFFERRMRERAAAAPGSTAAAAAAAAQVSSHSESKPPQIVDRTFARAAWPQPLTTSSSGTAAIATGSAGTAFGPGRFVRCTRCGRPVAPEAQAEHDDYHAARDLQREWNSQVMAEIAAARQRERASAAAAVQPQRQAPMPTERPAAAAAAAAAATRSTSKRVRQSNVTEKPAKTLHAYFRKA